MSVYTEVAAELLNQHESRVLVLLDLLVLHARRISFVSCKYFTNAPELIVGFKASYHNEET